MAKCKLNDCFEQAVEGPWRKRYCRAHGLRYLQRKRDHEARAAAAPKCTRCRTPLMSDYYKQLGLCKTCEDEDDRIRAEHMKWDAFTNADTVHDLKEWIREYMLDGGGY